MNNKENIDKQDKVIELLEEILRWTRLQGVQNAKAVLSGALEDDDKLKLAYHLSDGRPSTEIANACNVSSMTITNWWKRWFTLGIAQPSKKYKGRFEKAFSLEDLGIKIPSIKSGTKIEDEKQLGSEESLPKEDKTT